MNFEILHAMFFMISAMYRQIKSRKRTRRWKVRPLNLDYMVSGYQNKVFLQMKDIDTEQFFVQTRMSRPLFELLLTLVGSELTKARQRILAQERLAITLHFLAHGVPIQSLAWAHKLGKTTVRNIILETCEILWRVLSPIYVSEPTEAQYKDIASDFNHLWNMPNCVGAIDGKHIAIKCPANSGSTFHNYKKFFSVVLLAVCDAKYTFTAVSIGSYGSESDGGIIRNCPFGEALMGNTLPLPPDVSFLEVLPMPFPHFFVGDAAFPLRTNLMRPYPGLNLSQKKRIFNYRLSRARRCIENAFGILTVRWRVLRNTMEFSPQNAETVVLACTALHNFIMLNDQDRWYCPENYVDWEGPDHVIHEGGWRSDVNEIGGPLRSIVSFARRASNAAFQFRDMLADFFVNEGSVSFQNDIFI